MTAAPPADLLSHFGFLLKDVSRQYTRNFERHAAGLGLTIAQCRVLSHLQREPGQSQARLAELTESDPTTLGRLVACMIDDGLIERRPHPDDGRAHSLHLRRKAQALLDSIWQHSDRARAEALAGLSAAECSQLMALMQRVQDNLDTLLASPPRRATGTTHAN